MQRDLSHLTAKQRHSSLISSTSPNKIFPSKCDFHYSCAIQSQFLPQYQVSDDYPTSLHFVG